MMNIVAGTYEGFCYGWELSADALTTGSDEAEQEKILASATTTAPEADPSSPGLSLVFGYSVHVGCTKSVAMATTGTRAGQLLVTGGADERVRIYDMVNRTETGELQQHNGTVTCLEFFKSTHLLTGSEDHTVCIWRVHDWALLHVLGGHKAAVTSLSIHPSGRMALSVSRDRTLRLWNLLEGRCAYIKRLQGEGELVRWSSSGDSYMTVVGTTVVVYDASTSDVLGECKHIARVNSACFVGGDGKGARVATCSDDKCIRLFKTRGGYLLEEMDVSDLCATGRVRDMCFVANPDTDEGSSRSAGSLVAVTSAGSVHVWRVPSLGDVGASENATRDLRLPLLASRSVKGGPRFTCVAACFGEGPAQAEAARRKKNSKKRKARPPPPQQAADEALHGATGKIKAKPETKRKRAGSQKKRVAFRMSDDASRGATPNGGTGSSRAPGGVDTIAEGSVQGQDKSVRGLDGGQGKKKKKKKKGVKGGGL